MAETTPQKRVLPPRERRESLAKRRAISPPSTPQSTHTTRSATAKAVEEKPKRLYKKRASLAQVGTPARSASTPTSNADEFLPTRITNTRPLPTSQDRQSQDLSNKEYQSIADSAILSASILRSRMQWLCDGVFTKYWTKPVKRKGGYDIPPNNPDVKSMQKLGNATITLEPHTFNAVFYAVRDVQILTPGSHQFAAQPGRGVANPTAVPAKLGPPGPKTQPSVPVQAPAPTNNSTKTTDPVIQMLAARAATDDKLKELMKVVATSRASSDQLKEFQAHIDEFNTIVKQQQQQLEKDRMKSSAPSSPSVQPNIPHPMSAVPPGLQSTAPANSKVAPSLDYHASPLHARPEHALKHICFELTSPASSGVPASADRWLFPEYAVIDNAYNGTEMVCSFFIERKGSDLVAAQQTTASEGLNQYSHRWDALTEYYHPVTMTIRSPSHRLIEMISKAAKTLPEVQQYMRSVMEIKTRAPQEYLIYRLPRDKPDVSAVDFVDSAVELSAAEDDTLQDSYPL